MGRRVGVALAAAGVLLGLGATADGATFLSGPGTIRIGDKLVKHLHVHGGAPGHGAGDLDFFRQLLLTRTAHPKVIGHSDLSCLDTGTGSKNCTGTYFLPRGKLMVEGVIGSRLFYELAVVGGTGLYNNAKGTLTVTFLGGPPEHELLVFRLVV